MYGQSHLSERIIFDELGLHEFCSSNLALVNGKCQYNQGLDSKIGLPAGGSAVMSDKNGGFRDRTLAPFSSPFL